jgi:hypothetical protein
MARASADETILRSRSRDAALRGEDGAGALDDDEWDDGKEDAPLGFVPLAGRSPLGGDDGLDGLLDFEDGVEEEDVEEEVRCGRTCVELGRKGRGNIPGLQDGWGSVGAK